MCGRYVIDDDTMREIDKIVRSLSDSLSKIKAKGEVFPTNTVPVISAQAEILSADLMTWGFPRFNHSGVLINARAETLLERPTFRKSALERRCIVPARIFFEWDSNKNKLAFSRPDKSIMFMAGIYNTFKDEHRFTIITTQANASVNRVHNRMPLILEESELESWIHDNAALDYILHKVPTNLMSTPA